jgi:hypothetical protein
MKRILVLLVLIGGTVVVSSARGSEMVLERPSVVVVEARIVETAREGAGELGFERMLPFLEYFEVSKLPLVVVAEGFEGEELGTLVGERLEGLNRVVFLSPDPERLEVLRQIAEATGASILTAESDWESPAEISRLAGDVSSASIGADTLELELRAGGGSVAAGELGSLFGDTTTGGSTGSGRSSYPLTLVADTGATGAGEQRRQEYGDTSLGGALESILGGEGADAGNGGDFCCRENKFRWMEFRKLTADQVEKLKADCRKGRWFEGRCPTERRPWWECVLTVMQQGGVDARYMLWGSDREAEEFCRRLPGVNELSFIH